MIRVESGRFKRLNVDGRRILKSESGRSKNVKLDGQFHPFRSTSIRHLDNFRISGASTLSLLNRPV